MKLLAVLLIVPALYVGYLAAVVIRWWWEWRQDEWPETGVEDERLGWRW